MKKLILIFTAVVCASFISGCGQKGCAEFKGVKGVEHVFVIGYDGFAAHSTFDKAVSNMPTYKSLMDEGSWTKFIRTIYPSISAPNWSTMFCGVGPEGHGWIENNDDPNFAPAAVRQGENKFPSIVSVLREAKPEAKLGAICEWSTILSIIGKDYLDYSDTYEDYDANEKNITEDFIENCVNTKQDFAMCIFDNPDHMGHECGWGSEGYYNALAKLDENLAAIIQATKDAGIYDSTVFVLVSDHGGFANEGHGGITMDEMETPVVFFGKSIKKGYEIQSVMYRYDTAPTIAAMFGIKYPDAWRGRPCFEIFE